MPTLPNLLVARLRAAGLDTSVITSVGADVNTFGAAALVGRVDNIVATLPGTAPTGAVVLAAHYDSVAAGPSAADDGAAVAALLETVRALGEQPVAVVPDLARQRPVGRGVRGRGAASRWCFVVG